MGFAGDLFGSVTLRRAELVGNRCDVAALPLRVIGRRGDDDVARSQGPGAETADLGEGTVVENGP